MSLASQPRPAVRVIAPARGWWSALRLDDVVESRELIVFLAWRDIKVRYTQASLGVAWAVIQPLLMMLVFTIVLGRFAKVPSDGLPYSVFVLAGLVVWTFFANAVSNSSESLVASSHMLSKVSFPRMVIPLGAVIAWLPDLAISAAVVVMLAAVQGLHFIWAVLLLPCFAALAVLAATGAGVWLSALNVRYRDVRYAVPFLLQVGLFATPVVYPASLLPGQWRVLLGLNPMSGAVEGFRWCLLGQSSVDWRTVAGSALVAVIMLGSGIAYFRNSEQTFADVV